MSALGGPSIDACLRYLPYLVLLGFAQWVDQWLLVLAGGSGVGFGGDLCSWTLAVLVSIVVVVEFVACLFLQPSVVSHVTYRLTVARFVAFLVKHFFYKTKKRRIVGFTPYFSNNKKKTPS